MNLERCFKTVIQLLAKHHQMFILEYKLCGVFQMPTCIVTC